MKDYVPKLTRRRFGGIGLAAMGFVLRGMPRCDAAPADALAALGKLWEAKRIVNVHEHIQGPGNLPELLGFMDLAGIGKTVFMGSSWFTLALYERAGFSRYDENNAAITAMARDSSGRIEAWPTVRPEDTDKVEKIAGLLARGASGVKLYLGHGYTTRSGEYMFHTMALDDPRMAPLYAFCEAECVPMCMHVNCDKPGFADEFVSVLRSYPALKVNCPHYMLSSNRVSRLYELLGTFPNLYSDISFGHDEYLHDGLARLSGDIVEFKRLFVDYPERFFFGTDYVFTDFKRRTQEWAMTRTQAYFDLLTRDSYETPLLPGEMLKGLALPPATLENLLCANFERFKALRPKDTVITRDIRWENMRVRRVERAPGQALPPPPPERERFRWFRGRRDNG